MKLTPEEKERREFERWRKKQASKLSTKEQEEIRELEKQALRLWKKGVIKNAGKQCEAPKCKKTKFLQAHHVESYSTNKRLRYDLNNGLCLCPTHHKFGRHSAHKSFIFIYLLMTEEHPVEFSYLRSVYNEKTEITKEWLEEVIRKLS